MEKKKLLIATDNFLPRWDGIARFLAEIIPRLKEDYDITVISPDYSSSKLDKDIRRIRIPLTKFSWGDYTPAKREPKVIKEAVKQADVVFSQTIGPIGGLAIKYSKKLEKPLAAYIHSIEWELVPKSMHSSLIKKLSYPLAKFYTKNLLNKATLLICPSEKIADMLRWQKVFPTKKIAHLGVNTNVFKKTDKVKAKKALGLKDGSLVIGFHGRLGLEKNLLTLSRAYLRLKEQNKQLIIVGDGLKSLKEKLSKVKGIVLPGVTNDVVKYLNAMDIYVMPSYTETTSLAVLEAMSCELPVISSKVGFIQQYIKDGENGFFFDNKSAYRLAKKIELLAEDEKLREKIGKKARETVLAQFSWDVCAVKISNALELL